MLHKQAVEVSLKRLVLCIRKELPYMLFTVYLLRGVCHLSHFFFFFFFCSFCIYKKGLKYIKYKQKKTSSFNLSSCKNISCVLCVCVSYHTTGQKYRIHCCNSAILSASSRCCEQAFSLSLYVHAL